MTLQQFSPRFYSNLHAVALRWLGLGITPNTVSVFIALMSLLVGESVLVAGPQFTGIFFLIPTFLILKAVLKGIEQIMVQENKQTSGHALPIVEASDVLSEVFLYLPFAYLVTPPVSSGHFLALAFVLLSILAEFVGVMGYGSERGRRREGPLGKNDRAVAMSLWAVLYGFGAPLRVAMPWFFLALNLLLVYTIWNRIR